MNILLKSSILAASLAAFSTSAFADDLLGTVANTKGRTTVGLDLVTSGESTVFEFVVEVPKGAKNVDVSKCMKALPSTHTGQCVYRPEAGEIIGIAFSSSNAKLQPGALNLGSVSFSSLRKAGSGVTIRDLVVGNDRGVAIPSNVQVEDALLGN